MTQLSRLAPIALALAASLAGCDGSSSADAGPPDSGPRPIVFTVDDAVRVPIDDNSQLYALQITLEAQTVGPLAVAPNAFMLHLADGTVSIGASGDTQVAPDGCVSQSVALGSSVTCTVVFRVTADAADPATLNWADGHNHASASVPPIHS